MSKSRHSKQGNKGQKGMVAGWNIAADRSREVRKKVLEEGRRDYYQKNGEGERRRRLKLKKSGDDYPSFGLEPIKIDIEEFQREVGLTPQREGESPKPERKEKEEEK